MAQHTTIYQQAIYYDMVFNRDVSRDVDFLQQAYRLHAGGELSAVLDVACGPGYHARACAQRGLHGAGLDLRPEMIAYARDQATSEGGRSGMGRRRYARFPAQPPRRRGHLPL